MLITVNILPRMLGLDIGDSRTGVALSDALGVAQPLLTMGPSSDKLRVKNIARLVRKHEAVGVVAGNPLHMSGELSSQAIKVQAFAVILGQALQVPVYLQDERLSSIAANEHMDRLGFARGPERRAKLDQYAAVVILQDWLDARERQRTAPAEEMNAPGTRSL